MDANTGPEILNSNFSVAFYIYNYNSTVSIAYDKVFLVGYIKSCWCHVFQNGLTLQKINYVKPFLV